MDLRFSFVITRNCDKCGPLEDIVTTNDNRGSRVGATWTVPHSGGKCKKAGTVTLEIVGVNANRS